MGGTPISLVLNNLKKGDKAALEFLYKRYYSKLYGFVKTFRLKHVSPDDIVQQTFLRIWENRRLLKEGVPFERQLYTIAKNIVLNLLKREKRSTSLEDLMVLEAPLEDDMGDGPEKEQMLERLRQKISEMPARRREIFELHKFNGLSYLEISDKLKISQHTVASHLQLAINFLRKEL